MKIIKHFENLGFTVVINPEEYNVNYTIYDHEGQYEDGTFLYHKKDSGHYPDPVERIEDSEPYISGYVKWDGCSNWNFDEQERGMLHGCVKHDIVRYGLILGECWEMTKQYCKNWSD